MRKAVNTTRRYLLAAMICCIMLAPVASASVRGNLFVEMMLTMMEIMGFIDRDDDIYGQDYPLPGQFFMPGLGMPGMGMPGANWSSWPQTMAMQQPWGGYPGSMMPGMGAPNWSPSAWNPSARNQQSARIPFLPGYNPAKKYQSHWIEGRWYTSDGMIMEVYQGRFRMYYRQQPEEVRSGLIRIKDRWLGIYEESRQFLRQFEFAYKDDRLVLRDPDGNLMLMRRMTNWAIPLLPMQ